MTEMLNYIKSEFYRVFHSKGFYIFNGTCMVLVLVMNLLLWSLACTAGPGGFHYANTGFAFMMLYSGGFQAVLFLSYALSSIIFGAEFKNRTINNSIAGGCSRETLFIGKLIVTLVCCALTLVLVEGTLVGSGYLLLEDAGPEFLQKLLLGTFASIPGFICGACGAVALFYALGSDTKATWAWMILFVVVNIIVSLLGMKFDTLHHLSRWLVYNVLGENSMDPVTGMSVMIWETTEGLTRCVLSGVIGTVVFFILGLVGARRVEVK